MRFVAINGSPRGEKSNSNLLLQHFLDGYRSVAGADFQVVHLKTPGGIDRALAAFGEAEVVLLAFPLYADAMPGIVKELIEGLKRYQGRAGNPALVYLVQSGFPEGSHTRHLEPYLEKLARRLGCDYRGTIRRGGAEGIRIRPMFLTRPLFARMNALGSHFGRTGRLDEKLLAELAGKEMLGKLALTIGNKMGDLLFWNPALKRNGAFADRYGQPYRSDRS